MSKSEQSGRRNDVKLSRRVEANAAQRSMLPDVKDVIIARGFEDVRPGSISAGDATSKTVRLLIVGGYALLRDALRAFFMNTAGIQVVGEAEGGDAAFQLSCREMPDVILLLELSLACEREMSFLCRISSQELPMHTIMLASSLDQPVVLAAMKLGAKGVILKDSATTQLLCQAIHWVAVGGYWVGEENVPTLTHALQVAGVCSDDGPPQRRFGLTARESEILPMLAQGYSNRAIATAFSVSAETVKHHCSHIYDKLGTSNRVELALFAIHHHLVDTCLPAAL